MEPVSILPPEVWELIVNKLPTHKEKLSAYNTCSLWRSFLKEKRTVWMFQGVFPFLFNYLPRSDVLNMRLICKSWNGVIESFLETGQSFILSPGRHHMFTGRVMPFRTLQVDFDNGGYRRGLTTKQALQLFREQFVTADGGASCPRNPILSRSICLTLSGVDFDVLMFFETFGTYLLSLDLAVIQQPPFEISSPEQTVRFIWKLLALVPNLKKLVLRTGPNILCADEKQMKDVKQFLRCSVAPSLPHLCDLQINTDIGLMRISLETSYCSQLTKYVHRAAQEFIPMNLTNLTDLVMLFEDCGAKNQLEKLRNLDSPCLQRLHIYVVKHFVRKEANPPTCHLFETIETTMISLTHLSLFWACFEGTFPTTLNLPLVQEFSLEIKIFKNGENINFFFLQSLKSLRKLTLVLWEDSYDQLFDLSEKCEIINHSPMTENIDLRQRFDEDLNGGPHSSNIWRLLPSLEVIEIQLCQGYYPVPKADAKIYTRAGAK